MPRYKVIAPGFFDGRLYHPDGKRPVLDTAKPFPKKKMPSWLTLMPAESEAVKEKRELQELSEKDAVDQKIADDQNDISGASSQGAGEAQSFLSEGEPGSDDIVETI